MVEKVSLNYGEKLQAMRFVRLQTEHYTEIAATFEIANIDSLKCKTDL